MDLHPEEAVLSGIEDEERERSDQDLQIRRTVTQAGLRLPVFLREREMKKDLVLTFFFNVRLQVVHSESQENGQKEAKRSRHEDVDEEDLRGERAHEEKMDASFPAAVETHSPSHTSHDVEIINTGNENHPRTLLKRSN